MRKDDGTEKQLEENPMRLHSYVGPLLLFVA